MSFREALFHCGLTKELVVDVLGNPAALKNIYLERSFLNKQHTGRHLECHIKITRISIES